MRRFPKYKEPLKLNLGCGKTEMKGYVNIDNRDIGFNMVWDLRDGLPFPDDSVEEIFTSHFLEHLTDEESEAVVRDILRVLKPGGRAVCRVPDVSTPGAFYMGHRSFWNKEKIEAMLRFDNPLGKFVIIENMVYNSQLLFTLQKLR